MVNGTLSRLLRRCQVPAILYSLLAASFLLLTSQITFASQVTLAWDPSNEPGISGYKIYYGTSSRNYTGNADAGNTDTYTVTGLSQGQTYYFAVTAHDAQGHESSYSNEVSASIAAACTYSLSSASQSFVAAGGTGTVNISAGSGCSWTASNPASWITISSGQTGSGNGAIAYTVSQNTSATARSATLTIGGHTYTVSQTAAATACSYTLSSASQSFDANGGSGTVSVTTGSGCSWTASDSVAWVMINSGQTGTGNGTVGYTVSQNTSATARSATLTIGGRTYTVSQTAPQGGGGGGGGGGACTYSLSSASHSFDANGGTGTVNIVAGSGCSWTVSNPASWITISSGQTGSGSGTVTYTVSQNASDVDRLSALTIAGSPYTISQDASAASTTTPVSTPVTTGSNSGADGGGGGGGGGGGCFIATAAFGSYIDPHVMLLRSFRDAFLLTSRPGSAFVNWYYAVSPGIADSVQKSEALRAGVRIMLIPVIGFSYLCLTLGVLPTLFLIILMTITLVLMVRRIGD